MDVILGGYRLAGEGTELRIEPTVHDLANRVRLVSSRGATVPVGEPKRRSRIRCAGEYGAAAGGSLYALRAP